MTRVYCLQMMASQRLADMSAHGLGYGGEVLIPGSVAS